MIDAHVHLAALPEGDNGCYLSPRMLRHPLLRFLAWRLGLDLRNPTLANAVYLQRLRGELARSAKVQRAVLLGMDGVYDDKGTLDLGRTDFLISNRYVLEVAKRYPEEFLAGVSINPRRRDALNELDRCASAGAVLVKVLPNSQCFDPSESRHIPFYRALARYRMPLLSHVGYEFSLMGKDQSAGDPARLRLALDEGVYVIAAHACSYGLLVREPYFKVLKEFVRAYPNFYTDASALTLPNRSRMLFLLRRCPELYDRLLFGTDYPLPVFPYPVLGKNFTKVTRATNSFDRHALVLESLGIRCVDFSVLLAKIRP